MPGDGDTTVPGASGSQLTKPEALRRDHLKEELLSILGLLPRRLKLLQKLCVDEVLEFDDVDRAKEQLAEGRDFLESASKALGQLDRLEPGQNEAAKAELELLWDNYETLSLGSIRAVNRVKAQARAEGVQAAAQAAAQGGA